MNPPPTVIVVAAGQGRRFGGSTHKLRQRLAGGTVLGSTIRHAVRTHWPVVVVTTAALVDLATPVIPTRDLVVLSDSDARRGMGHSISVGVAAHADAPGWLVLPGDMPLVQPATIVAVGQALATHPVAYAQHQGRRGHPVAFAAELFSELMALQGDEGARRLLARYPAAAVEVEDPGVLVDVDTAQDLDSVREAQGSSPV